MDDIIGKFYELLSTENVTEQDCQDYLELNSELIFAPFLLNHWIHFGAIISKFPLDTALVTDFAYLTKSSDFWHFVLVELEHPNKQLFRTNPGQIVPTAELTTAIAQIHTWQDFVHRNSNEVLRRLLPLRKPLTNNPVIFKYLLVIGRSEQKSKNQRMRDRLARLGNNDFLICTYDSLISAYQESPKLKKNIIRMIRNRFDIKYLHGEPGAMFAHLTPEDLIISPEQREILLSLGYEIDKWEQGELLRYNNKKTKMESSFGA
jgi:hypothetical protein